MRASALLLAAVAMVAVAPTDARAQDAGGAADEAQPDRREFDRLWRGREVATKASAFRLLDPGRASALPLIHEGLRTPNWLVRGEAAAVAAQVPEGPLRFQLRVDLITHEDVRVREGLAYALAMAPNAKDAEALASALEDPAPLVRQEAARGLRDLPSRGALEALVKALYRETEPRPRTWILATLRRLTRTDRGTDPRAWLAWWKEHRDDEALQPPADVPPDDREFAGVRLEVVTDPGGRTGDGDTPGRRKPHLLVLAPFGWTHAVYTPWFDEFGSTFHVHHVRLPTLAELTGMSGYGDRIAAYPVKKLAKALDALRDDLGAAKVVILAEGATAWIAEAYAAVYPKRTAGLLLLNAWLDAPAYVEALKRTATQGSVPQREVAKNLLGLRTAARDARENEWIARVDMQHSLMDPSDLIGHHLWSTARDAAGFATVPSLRFDARTRMNVPALWVFASDHPMSGHPEAQRIRDAFPNAIIATIRETRGLPWIDRPDEFHRIVRGFVERHHLGD